MAMTMFVPQGDPGQKGDVGDAGVPGSRGVPGKTVSLQLFILTVCLHACMSEHLPLLEIILRDVTTTHQLTSSCGHRDQGFMGLVPNESLSSHNTNCVIPS